MAEVLLPRWIITQSLMPAGRRTGKKPVFEYPTTQRIEIHSHRPSFTPIKNAYEPAVIENMFDHWEYRFWAMVPFSGKTTMVAECRCCGHVGSNDLAARRKHPSIGGCTKRLLAAYKLLQRDSRCVICDGTTTQEKWGVPLCSSGCQQAWCENEAQPSSLMQALAIVGDNY